jgi:hypothetical protein
MTVVFSQVDVESLCNTNFDCVNNAECLEGQCQCRAGFIANAAKCEDINECEAGPCGKNAYCVNTQGSFFCNCEAGFLGDPLAGCKGNR